MPVLFTLKSEPWNNLPFLCLVLLMVPVLSGCRGRTILGSGLDSGAPKESKRLVVGHMLDPRSAASNLGPSAGFSGKNAATIWFTRAEGGRLTYVSEERVCPVQFKDTDQALTFAMTELLAGPEGQDETRGQNQASSQTQSRSLAPSSTQSPTQSRSLAPSSTQSPTQSRTTSQEPSRAISSENASKTSSEIPVGTMLIKVSDDKAGGEITVDLSRRFVQGGGMDSFEARLEQVKRTIAGVAGGKPVYLNVEGERLTASGDGLEVRQPINGDANSNAGSN